MKSPRALIVLLAGSSLLLSGCATPPEPEAPAVDLAAERAAIEGLIAAQLAATNQPGDAGADGYVSVASEDLVLLPPNGERVNGRPAAREWVLQFTSSPEFSVTYAAETVEVATSRDLAYAIGSYEYSLLDADGNTVTDRGKFMDGFRKGADGNWEITVLAFNSDLPVEPQDDLSPTGTDPLIEEISLRSGLSGRESAAIIDGLGASIADALVATGRLNLSTGLGSFAVRRISARSARDPETGGLITIPARNAVVFVFRGAVTRALNGEAVPAFEVDSDLVVAVSERTSLPTDSVAGALTAAIDAIYDGLQQGKAVTVPGIGTYGIEVRRARTGWNPQTGEPVPIAAENVPDFSVAQTLSAAVD